MATEEEFGKAPAAPVQGAGDVPFILLAVKRKKCFTKRRKPKTKTVSAAPEDLVL